MTFYPQIHEQKQEYAAWRRQLHAHPELAYEEHRTSAFVASTLEDAGVTAHTGFGKTGVVGVLKKGRSPKVIALRADLDALPIQEQNGFEHKSTVPGVHHGCGHDGHTVMLLAAAQYLSRHSTFDGTVCFVFQPAEEGKGGAAAMIEDGLFREFPIQSIYGMHNAPGLPVGQFGIRPGAMLAAYEGFDIRVSGSGGHGAMPQLSVDPILIASELVNALQSIVSRNIDPGHAAVLSVTKIQSGESYNVIPDSAILGGGIRYFDAEVGNTVKARMTDLVHSICAAFGGSGELSFVPMGYPPLYNDPKCTKIAVRAARSLVGEKNVSASVEPIMGSDDFAYMLQEKPGSYILVGNGTSGHSGKTVHHPEYDFNDDVIPYGAGYWARLAELELNAA